MEEAELEELREEHLLPNRDQIPDLGLRQRAEPDAVHPLGDHHAARRQFEQRRGDDEAIRDLGRSPLLHQLLHFQSVQSLVAEVQLGVEALRKGLCQRDVVGLVVGEAPDERLRHIGQAPEHIEVLGDRRQRAGALDLDRDLLPGLPHNRPVHLRQGCGGDGFLAEAAEYLGDGPLQLKHCSPRPASVLCLGAICLIGRAARAPAGESTGWLL
mmetsp:Transcript_75071/g.244071  ORF Transcript_75071/g.244071 Transcript_75071/m.244071 type:complete len:213 (-) Transcript_75071:726-1364(-)